MAFGAAKAVLFVKVSSLQGVLGLLCIIQLVRLTVVSSV